MNELEINYLAIRDSAFLVSIAPASSTKTKGAEFLTRLLFLLHQLNRSSLMATSYHRRVLFFPVAGQSRLGDLPLS